MVSSEQKTFTSLLKTTHPCASLSPYTFTHDTPVPRPKHPTHKILQTHNTTLQHTRPPHASRLPRLSTFPLHTNGSRQARTHTPAPNATPLYACCSLPSSLSPSPLTRGISPFFCLLLARCGLQPLSRASSLSPALFSRGCLVRVFTGRHRRHSSNGARPYHPAASHS